MIYSNTTLQASEKEMSWGKLRAVSLGEYGRGRVEIVIPVPAGLKEVPAGLNKDITIGLTKSNKPRVDNVSDNRLFMLLSSYGGYTRRGNGAIQVYAPQRDNVKVLASGNGADGDAGRIGEWDVSVIEIVAFPTIVRVCYSGGRESKFIFIDGPDVMSKEIPFGELDLYADAVGRVIPFEHTLNPPDGCYTDAKQWTYL